MSPRGFSTAQWIAWLGATIVAAITGSGFIFGTFQSKADAREDKADTVIRMDRLEQKIDRLDDKIGGLVKYLKQ